MWFVFAECFLPISADIEKRDKPATHCHLDQLAELRVAVGTFLNRLLSYALDDLYDILPFISQDYRFHFEHATHSASTT